MSATYYDPRSHLEQAWATVENLCSRVPNGKDIVALRIEWSTLNAKTSGLTLLAAQTGQPDSAIPALTDTLAHERRIRTELAGKIGGNVQAMELNNAVGAAVGKFHAIKEATKDSAAFAVNIPRMDATLRAQARGLEGDLNRARTLQREALTRMGVTVPQRVLEEQEIGKKRFIASGRAVRAMSERGRERYFGRAY
ncbi:hypothetical protein JCM8547_005324 [Rhodosporidiobolus lusitaniae]